MKVPKVAQLHKVVSKWFTAMPSERKQVTKLTIIGNAKYIYDKIKLTDKCIFSEGSNKQLPV
jgi:hypothetical protein